MAECFHTISTDKDCRAVVLSANGKHFTAGLDLSDMGELMSILMSDDDVSRRFRLLQGLIARYQDSFTSIEKVLIYTSLFVQVISELGKSAFSFQKLGLVLKVQI